VRLWRAGERERQGQTCEVLTPSATPQVCAGKRLSWRGAVAEPVGLCGMHVCARTSNGASMMHSRSQAPHPRTGDARGENGQCWCSEDDPRHVPPLPYGSTYRSSLARSLFIRWIIWDRPRALTTVGAGRRYGHGAAAGPQPPCKRATEGEPVVRRHSAECRDKSSSFEFVDGHADLVRCALSTGVT
jgi:hypothetical protein